MTDATSTLTRAGTRRRLIALSDRRSQQVVEFTASVRHASRFTHGTRLINRVVTGERICLKCPFEAHQMCLGMLAGTIGAVRKPSRWCVV
jgi:hypothetical protein